MKKLFTLITAVCMLIIGCIGIYSSIKNMNKIIEESDFEYDDGSILSDTEITNPFEVSKDFEIIDPDVPDEKAVVLAFMKPVDGEICKQFSNGDLIYSETMNDYRTHNGVDILTTDGSPVCSSEAGTISSVDNHPLWGTCVTINHENGITTCYMNLSEDLPEGVETGSYVARGGIIGTAGTTALVEIGEQTHLHFEMYVNGEAVDPVDYFV